MSLPDPNSEIAKSSAATVNADQTLAAAQYDEAKARALALGLTITTPTDQVSVPVLATPIKEKSKLPLIMAGVAIVAVGYLYWKGKLKWPK